MLTKKYKIQKAVGHLCHKQYASGKVLQVGTKTTITVVS
jgi:hypothetical protein